METKMILSKNFYGKLVNPINIFFIFQSDMKKAELLSSKTASDELRPDLLRSAQTKMDLWNGSEGSDSDDKGGYF